MVIEPSVKTGRPRGDLSRAVEAAIRESGQAGMTLEQLRQAFPGDQNASLKFAVSNLRDRKGFLCLSEGRLSVYYAPGCCGEEANEIFRSRIAAMRAASKEKQRQYTRDYLARRAAEVAAAKAGQKAEAERLRAERKEKVAQEKAARKAQQDAEMQRRAALHASKRKEMEANNILARRIKGDGTRGATKELAVPATEDWSRAKVTIAPRTPGRFEVLGSPGPFTSMRPGQYAFEASSCAARALS